MKRILVVAAHPDDEVLGCGATIAKHTAQGDEMSVLILGEGIRARKNTHNLKGQIRQLKEASRRANKILGVKHLIQKNFPDNALDTVPLLKIIRVIEATVKKLKPQVIYTHHYSDVNIDHRMVARAMQAVMRPLPGNFLERVLAFEVPSSTEWNFQGDTSFQPNFFVNVDGHLQKALQACGEYRSEMRPFPHPRSREYIEALAKIRGGQSGFSAAEAFSLVYERW